MHSFKCALCMGNTYTMAVCASILFPINGEAPTDRDSRKHTLHVVDIGKYFLKFYVANGPRNLTVTPRFLRRDAEKGMKN